jgi:hypothetical protein
VSCYDVRQASVNAGVAVIDIVAVAAAFGRCRSSMVLLLWLLSLL